MQKIPLSLAKPGMKLAKPITKANGMPIIAAGVELSESLIERLVGMGIDKVCVVGDQVAASQNPSERVARLDHLFRRMEGDEWMRQVKKELRGYFTIRAAAETANAAPACAAGSESQGKG